MRREDPRRQCEWRQRLSGAEDSASLGRKPNQSGATEGYQSDQAS